jgi:hypothetical protein
MNHTRALQIIKVIALFICICNAQSEHATVDDIPPMYVNAFEQSAYPFEDNYFYNQRPIRTDYYWDGMGWIFDNGYEVENGRCRDAVCKRVRCCNSKIRCSKNNKKG